MTDFVWPPSLRQSSVEWRFVSNSEQSFGLFSGIAQTASRPGDRIACTVRVTNASGARRRRLRALANLLRGSTNRIFIPDLGHTRAGSIASGELFTNSDFSNGTTGWSVAGTGTAISASDDSLRLAAGAGGGQPQIYQVPTTVQYAPYALRSFVRRGSIPESIDFAQQINNSPSFATTGLYDDAGYLMLSGVMSATSGAMFPVYIAESTGYQAGVFLNLDFASFSRCLQVDGGGNLFLRSNALGTSPWTLSSGTAVSDNGTAAPDGSLTALYIQEQNNSNIEHQTAQDVGVTSAGVDCSISVSAKANARNWLLLRLVEATGGTNAYAWFNVSTGVIGTLTTGANWSNLRWTIKSQGNGWYRCTLVARKTNAATTITGVVQSATADTVTSYAGVATTVPLLIWEANLKADSVTSRGTATTSAAVSAASQSGAAIYVKGGPASVQGALRVGDAFEIDKQLKFATANLDLDASGCGYLQFEPALPRAVADNTPIIIHEPMCKMLMVGEVVESARPGGVSDFEFEFMQDLAA